MMSTRGEVELFEIRSSHVAMISHPEAVTRLIRAAAGSTS